VLSTEKDSRTKGRQKVIFTNKNWFTGYGGLIAALVCAGMLAIPAVAHDYFDDDTEVAAPFTRAPGSVIQGSGRISFDKHSVHAEIELDHLKPGDVYTIWFAYLDKPENCQVQGCADADFVGNDPAGVFGRMDGVVAGRSGQALFSRDFRNLKLSSKSMVWLIVFGHGKASSEYRFLARQLLTPQDPGLGAPGLGTASDGAVGVGQGVVKLMIP
jgi:hypothetical protein